MKGHAEPHLGSGLRGVRAIIVPSGGWAHNSPLILTAVETEAQRSAPPQLLATPLGLQPATLLDLCRVRVPVLILVLPAMPAAAQRGAALSWTRDSFEPQLLGCLAKPGLQRRVAGTWFLALALPAPPGEEP